MATATNPNILTTLSLFQGLSAAQLARLRDYLRPKTLRAGSHLITAEQPGEFIYFVLRGTLKIHIEQADGQDVILAILGRGDTVGEMSLIDDVGRSASVLALEDTSLLWMDGVTFQRALHEMPDLAMNLIKLLTARIRMADAHVQALAALDVRGRVARQILAFADRYGEPNAAGHTLIPIRLTQRDIADLVGASRKRVNQVMVAFKQQGAIAVQSTGQITLKRREDLVRYCG
ncbi:MAG: Crp/Fnr family transcriptional regulator [Anaerolineae bacterium]|nr:Crp/Fnr family transcriptional regulator [Anaerolineae bacterium]